MAPATEHLVLSAKRSTWRMLDGHSGEADKAFQSVRHSVLEAAGYTCQMCNWRASKWQEVHHRDDDHTNNQLRNLMCVCPLCHQVYHLGLAGTEDRGVMIYLPELTQEEINQLSLIAWLVAQSPKGSFELENLRSRTAVLMTQFQNRRAPLHLKLKPLLKEHGFAPGLLEKITIDHLTTPVLWANLLMRLPDDLYDKREELLGGLRLWPLPARFRRQIEAWEGDQRKTLPPDLWHKILGGSGLSFDDLSAFASERAAAIEPTAVV